jgi:hypothetical protein
MIIVEGCDNTGKSTLIKEIGAEFHPYLHTVKSPGYPGILTWVKEEFRNPGRFCTVYDRFYFSEFVYGPTLRHEMGFNHSDQSWIEWQLRRSNAMLVLCVRPLDKIVESINEREQWEGVPEKIADIASRYMAEIPPAATRTKIPWMFYDYEVHDKGEVIDFIKANHREMKQWSTSKI